MIRYYLVRDGDKYRLEFDAASQQERIVVARDVTHLFASELMGRAAVAHLRDMEDFRVEFVDAARSDIDQYRAACAECYEEESKSCLADLYVSTLTDREVLAETEET